MPKPSLQPINTYAKSQGPMVYDEPLSPLDYMTGKLHKTYHVLGEPPNNSTPPAEPEPASSINYYDGNVTNS